MWTFGHSILKAWTPACPAGISWLSQSRHARRLSAANVPLTACHVSPYWRSEVEWNDSCGLHRGRKGSNNGGSVAGWREPPKAYEHAKLLFPQTQVFIVMRKLFIFNTCTHCKNFFLMLTFFKSYVPLMSFVHTWMRFWNGSSQTNFVISFLLFLCIWPFCDGKPTHIGKTLFFFLVPYSFAIIILGFVWHSCQ